MQSVCVVAACGALDDKAISSFVDEAFASSTNSLVVRASSTLIPCKKTRRNGQEWKRERKTEIKENSKFLLQILDTTDGAVHPCAPTVEVRWQSRQTLNEGLTGILVFLSLTENTIVVWGRHP